MHFFLRRRFRVAASLICFLTACTASPDLDAELRAKAECEPKPEGLDGEIETITGGPGTGCVLGESFKFFYRAGTVDNIVIEFGDGGACWSEASCQLMKNVDERYRDVVNRYTDNALSLPLVRREAWAPYWDRGIHNHCRSSNPVKDWHHVYIPYCTADVHVGNSVQGAGDAFRHKGKNNVQFVLEWLEKKFRYRVGRLLLTGCSAGAYGSMFWSHRIFSDFAQNSPGTKLFYFGDSGAGVADSEALARLMRGWSVDRHLFPNTALGEGDDGGMASLYRYIVLAHPNASFTLFNHHQDRTQRAFYAALQLSDDEVGNAESLLHWLNEPPGLLRNLAVGTRTFVASPTINRAVEAYDAWPDYLRSQLGYLEEHAQIRVYVAEGSGHCRLHSDAFYDEGPDPSASPNSKSLAAWLYETVLSERDPRGRLQNVICHNCWSDPPPER